MILDTNALSAFVDGEAGETTEEDAPGGEGPGLAVLMKVAAEQATRPYVFPARQRQSEVFD